MYYIIGAEKDYGYQFNFGLNKYYVILDAGTSLGTDGKPISFKTYESDSPISLNQNLIWPHVDAVMETYSEVKLSTFLPTQITVPESSVNQFCSGTSPEQSDMGRNDVSGGYVFNPSEKKVTFELKLNTTRSKEGYSSPLQKILLGFSEDKTWGNDLVISCDTHRHISAFGQWKV